ncbi:NUT family member 1 [Pipistrellus kuhlii]|uniref:NUT midline carcinoma family member 1 n=1 Tax=Pipistrellus kuhlii TaxID=59472 RepID=A0A7J8B3U0_PIPKU|nr:NUT family member 1 [Pipistrellus kuhlii]KAF6393115.1 NUT midline carcinoma family member 1 [Pipistrellus kuhlii]
MTSDGASPLPGPDMTMKPGPALSPFTALPTPPSAPGPPDQAPWELPPQPSVPSAFSPGNPLVLSAFPNPVLVTGDGVPGHSGAEAGKVIVKVKTEGGAAEPSQAQNFILTQTAHNWIASSAPCGGSEGPPPQFVIASNVKTLLPSEAVGVSQEGLPGLPAQVAAPAAQLAPIVPPEKAWPGPHGATGEGVAAAQPKPSLADLSYTSKGVYENFRRWQRYKALARKHLSQSPDAEALSCFLIPVLRSLARLKPTMTLEEGLPRAVQEWDRTSNFDRMIFYEMAEKFMEFEAEEEMQTKNTQLVNGPQGLPPAAPLKVDPPQLRAPEVCQQPVYIPKKAASKARTPRRRQRKTQRPPVPEAPKEIPPEAVKEYADIMEGLVGSHLAPGESDGRLQEDEQRQEEDGMYPDPDLLSYIDELCSQEVFVSKVEAVIHPQFLADLLSPEQQKDPLALIEELEQEEGLSLAQLVQKRLLALEEEEDAEAAPSCTGAQLDSSASVSDEDEDGGGRLRPSPGHQVAGGTVCLGKSASPGKRAREVHSGQERALDGPRGMCRDGNTLTPPSSWDLHIELASPQGTRGAERGPGKVPNQIFPQPGDHVGGAGSPGHSLVADGTSEALSLCWQEDPQLEIVPSLEAVLAGPELVPLQEPGLQIGQQAGGVGVMYQGQELLAEPQEGCSGVMWGGDISPVLQSFDQSPSPRAAEDKDEDGASFSPGLWLSSEMDEVGLELPLQIEVTETFQDDGECVLEHQGGCQALGLRETTAPGGLGSSPIPCGGTGATAALDKRNYSLALRPRGNREQSPETLQDLSDLWAQACSPLLEGSIDASTLVSKETLLPACPGNVILLGTQDASTFPEANQEAGNRGSSISLLGTTVDSHILDVRDGCGLQLGVSEDTCPLHFSYHPQGEGREDTDLLNSKDLDPFLGNQESYAHGTPKLTSSRGLARTSPRWGARDASVLKEASPVRGAHSTAGGAKGQEEEEEEEEEEEDEEDEELSDFAYLLASKLSLSSRRPPLGPHPAPGLSSTGGQGLQRASRSLSAERGGPGQPPYPVAKSRKRALVAGPVPAGKRPYLGAELAVSGETPSQPRKRRRDSLGAGRRKKRRRCQ